MTPGSPPPTASPAASAVLITYGRAARLPRVLSSLFAQDYRPLQIVVVDDGSPDNTEDVLRARAGDCPPDVVWTVRRHGTNRGIGPARNTGIEAATGDFIAFLDDDCVARPDWITELGAALDASKEIAAVGGGVDEPENPTWAQKASEGMNYLGDRPKDVASVVGCNMAWRADFLRDHPFDPSVRYGADELDLCFAARAAGYRVRFTPHARVTHHHRTNIAAFLRQQYQRGRGSVWVRRKHRLGFWPRKHWLVLGLLASAAVALALPATATLAAFGAVAVLWLLQILCLDHVLGKSLRRSIATLPLVALGYLAEFAGAVRGRLRS